MATKKTGKAKTLKAKTAKSKTAKPKTAKSKTAGAKTVKTRTAKAKTVKEGGVIATIIASHTPRMAIEEKAWDFTKGLIQGLRDMGKAARALEPDLFVVNTTHWITTFDWVFTAHPRNKGICIAEEAPHLVPLPRQQNESEADF